MYLSTPKYFKFFAGNRKGAHFYSFLRFVAFPHTIFRTCNIADQPKTKIVTFTPHEMLIAGTNAKSINHRSDRNTSVFATKYIDLKGHSEVIL